MSKVKTYNPTTQQWEESYIGGNVPVMKINNTLPNQTTGNIDLTIPTKTSDLTNDSGYITGMEILKYGTSTWNDFITAYNAKKVVYCRASSNANPATGSQTRLAFMAYVNNETSPTQVEFQYVRSVSSHSATQQGDQVFIYLLKNTNGGTWSVTTREMSTKIVAGDGLSSSYSSGTLTLNSSPSYIKVNQTTDQTAPTGGTLNILFQTAEFNEGSLFSLLSSGYVQCTSDKVHHIKVTFTGWIERDTGYMWCKLYKNNTSLTNAVEVASYMLPKAISGYEHWESISFSTITTIQKNEVIYPSAYFMAADNINAVRGGTYSNSTYMLIEVLD